MLAKYHSYKNLETKLQFKYVVKQREHIIMERYKCISRHTPDLCKWLYMLIIIEK